MSEMLLIEQTKTEGGEKLLRNYLIANLRDEKDEYSFKWTQ